MALGARLELRQGQSLVITPQLQQAIKLLQLSNIELDAFVEQELEKNPLLVREDPPADAAEPSDDAPPADDSYSMTETPGRAETELDARPDDLHDCAPGDYATGDAMASQPAADVGGTVDWTRAGTGGGGDIDADGLEGVLTREVTLADHLTEQLQVLRLSPAERAVATLLIDGVDEGGYLRLDLQDVAIRLGCAAAMVESVLQRLQGFDPVGVFARDVRECLMLQLAERDRLDPAMRALLDNLDLLARRDFAALRRVCGVDDEDLRDMAAELRGLTPRPGAAFGSAPVQSVVPDVFVREDGFGGWRIDLNSDTLPRLLVDQRYHAQVARASRTEAEKTFVSDCFASANWLVKSLDQRARTILKVSSEIVRQQDAFLAFGVEHLRPLNLKTVADAIGMHESTISRVTSNKYIATPRGLFELKFFFTSSIASSDGGEAHSAESVRHRIKQLIDGESDGRYGDEGVLSDDRIVEILKASGVEIARRTVAKYREALRIPSSVERKRQLRLAS
jgi:RNA polymerase sigma-54 factor